MGPGTNLSVVNNLVVGSEGTLDQTGGTIDPRVLTIAPGGRVRGSGDAVYTDGISDCGTLFATGDQCNQHARNFNSDRAIGSY